MRRLATYRLTVCLTIAAAAGLAGRVVAEPTPRVLKAAGHPGADAFKAVGKDHVSVGHALRFADDPGHQAVLQFIRTQAAQRR